MNAGQRDGNTGFSLLLMASCFVLAQGSNEEFLQTQLYAGENLSPVVSLLLCAPFPLALFGKSFSVDSQAKILSLGCHLNSIREVCDITLRSRR